MMFVYIISTPSIYAMTNDHITSGENPNAKLVT